MKKIFFALFLVGLLVFSGCVQQPENGSNPVLRVGLEESQIQPILAENTDFSDWRNDFVAEHNIQPNLLLLKKERLSQELVEQMIEESPVGMKNVTEHILSDLPLESGNLFYIEMQDKDFSHKGIIAIIDAGGEKILKFFATLGIASS